MVVAATATEEHRGWSVVCERHVRVDVTKECARERSILSLINQLIMFCYLTPDTAILIQYVQVSVQCNCYIQRKHVQTIAMIPSSSSTVLTVVTPTPHPPAVDYTTHPFVTAHWPPLSTEPVSYFSGSTIGSSSPLNNSTQNTRFNMLKKKLRNKSYVGFVPFPKYPLHTRELTPPKCIPLPTRQDQPFLITASHLKHFLHTKHFLHKGGTTTPNTLIFLTLHK